MFGGFRIPFGNLLKLTHVIPYMQLPSLEPTDLNPPLSAPSTWILGWCFFPLVYNCRIKSIKVFPTGNWLFIISVKSTYTSQDMIVILISIFLLIFTHSYIHIHTLMNDTLFGAFCRVVHGHEKRTVPFCLMHGLDFSYLYLCTWVMAHIYLIFI